MRACVIGLAWLAAAACANLSPLPAGLCGNGVIESGEDCDRLDDPSCAACRLTCAQAADCPAGWGCGADGVCRHATGRFVEVGQRIDEDVLDIRVGDLDGDGRPDILGYGESRVFVYLGQPEFRFEDGLRVANLLFYGAPVVGDVNLDGFADGVAGGPRSLAVVRGGVAEGIIPVPQPAISVPAPELLTVTLRAGTLPFEEILVGQAQSGVLGLVVAAFGGEPSDPLLVGVGHDLDELAGSAVGDVQPGASQQVAIVFAGDSVAHVVALGVDGMGRPVPVALPPVALPAPATGAPMFGDRDGNGQADLFVPTEAGVAVAHATGGALAASATLRPELAAVGTLLGVDDLDGDGDADYAGTVGIAFAEAGALELRSFAVEPWTAVVFGDFNRDGFRDLAASTTVSTINLHFGGPAGLFTRFGLLLEGPASAITAGDFDGDRIDDLAYVVASAQSAGRLELAFGRTDGAPEARVRVGDFGAGARLARGSFVIAGSELTFDDTIDLLVQSPAPGGGGQDLTVLIGTSERLPIAPFDPGIDPSGFVIGRFAGGPEPDILVLPRGAADGRLVIGRGSSYLVVSDLRSLVLGDYGPWCLGDPAVDAPAPSQVAGDLDGDGVDEIVNLTCETGTVAQVARLGGEEAQPTFGLAETIAIGGDYRPARVGLGDADGDGDVDFMAVLAGAAPGEGAFLLIRSQDGLLGAPELLETADLDGGTPLAFAVIELDGDPAPEIALATTRGVLRVETGAGGLVAEVAPLLDRVVTMGQPADLDADGVTDLVLADSVGELRFYRGVPHDQ